MILNLCGNQCYAFFFFFFLINLLLKNLIKFNNTILDIEYEVQELNEEINALRLKYVFHFIIGFAIIEFGWILVCFFAQYLQIQ